MDLMHGTSTFAGSFAGRFAPLVALLVLSAACRDTTPAGAYEVRGIVSELSEDGGSIVLAHEQIADYMPAMTMEFPLGHPDLDDGLEPGDQIRFQIVVDASGRPTILHVEEEKIFSGLFPKFSLRTPGGEIIDSGLLSGKVAVVNFWASWCAPCRLEAPGLRRVSDRYRERGVRFLGVDYRDDDAAGRAFVDEFRLTYPSVTDPSGSLAYDYELIGFPTTFIIDAAGTIRYRFVGYLDEEVLADALDDVLSRVPA